MTVVRGQCWECVAGALYIVYHCYCCLWLEGGAEREHRVESHWPDTSSLQPPLHLTKVAGAGGHNHSIGSHMTCKCEWQNGAFTEHWSRVTIPKNLKLWWSNSFKIWPRGGGCFTLTGSQPRLVPPAWPQTPRFSHNSDQCTGAGHWPGES